MALELADNAKNRRLVKGLARHYAQARLLATEAPPAVPDLPFRERVRDLCAAVPGCIAGAEDAGAVVVIYAAPVAAPRTRAQSQMARADAFTRLLTAATDAGYPARLDKGGAFVRIGEKL